MKTRLHGTSLAALLLAAAFVAHAAVKTLKLSDASGGQAMSATVGMLIDVDLSPGMIWSDVNITDARFASDVPVLKRLSSTTSVSGESHAVFRVVRSGQTSLKAVGHATCVERKPCVMFVLPWTVLVTVPEPL